MTREFYPLSTANCPLPTTHYFLILGGQMSQKTSAGLSRWGGATCGEQLAGEFRLTGCSANADCQNAGVISCRPATCYGRTARSMGVYWPVKHAFKNEKTQESPGKQDSRVDVRRNSVGSG